ncbi:MAG: hypothetical protein AAGA72_03390 [Pseudomonadota bacterium]
MTALQSPVRNALDGSDHVWSPRREQFISLDGSNVAFRAMIYRGQTAQLRPLLILNSVEFSMPPSMEFCERMWATGMQVVFVERLGFGSSSPLPGALLESDLIDQGAAAAAEAVLLQRLISQLQLQQVVLLGMGSANPVCYRLSLLSTDISLSLYSNVVFNKDILDVFHPKWLQEMFRLMLHSSAGVKIASAGIKHRLRHKPLEFYRLLMHQSRGDVRYLEANPADFVAAGQLFQRVDWKTIDYDMRTSLKPDPLLKDGLFSGVRAVAFSGAETPEHWQTQLNSEAERLSIPVAYAPHGDFLAPYASPDFLTSIIEQNVGTIRAG